MQIKNYTVINLLTSKVNRSALQICMQEMPKVSVGRTRSLPACTPSTSRIPKHCTASLLCMDFCV